MPKDLEATTLPDEPLAPALPDLDEIQIIDGDEDEALTLEPRRAQNDPVEGDGDGDANDPDDGSDPDLADIKDADARGRVMAERRAARQRQTEMLGREERTMRELFAAEKRNAAIQRDAAKMALDGVDLRIRTATEALKAAKIDDDRASEVELDAQLRELHRVRSEVLDMQGKIPSDDVIAAGFSRAWAERVKEIGPVESDAVRPQSATAQRWAQANTWVGSKKHAAENQALVTISNQLAAEGYDINQPEHFVELSRRMAKTFPHLPIKDLHGRALSGAQPQKKSTDAPPVASARTTAPRGQAPNPSKGQVRVEGTDRRMMRVLGLDPNDKRVKERFAREKLSRLRAEQVGR